MINKHVIGRLGNQMFQYATVRAFQIKNNLQEDNINLDFTEVYSRANEGGYINSLEYFNTDKYSMNKMKMTFIQKFLYLFQNTIKFIVLQWSKISKNSTYTKRMYKIEKKLQPFFNKYGLYSFRTGYFDFKNSSYKNKCFFGTFESPKYFNEIKEQLKKEFTPKYGILEKNKAMYKKINNSESVCVTIRRGDFVSNLEYKKNLYVCDEKYFEKAINLMSEKLKNPKFFVFSDDIDWVKKNMKFPKNTEYETGDDPVWEKLRLMYSCKHFIISNSTFSWWAQYLSNSNNKIVIAPKRWGNDLYKDDNELIDIYEDNWILINN